MSDLIYGDTGTNRKFGQYLKKVLGINQTLKLIQVIFNVFSKQANRYHMINKTSLVGL